VDAATLAYISTSGTDSGTCTVTNPCRTIDYATTMLGTRSTIYIVGASYVAQATVQLGARAFTLTSDHAVLTGADPIFKMSAGTTAGATLRALTLGASGGSAKSLIVEGTTLTLQDVTLEQPFQVDASGALEIVASVIDAPGTTSATTSIRRSTLHAGITVTAGSLRYDSNKFQSTTGAAIVDTDVGGDVQILDSVFVTDGTGPVITMSYFATVAFCTFVTTQASSGPPFTCSGPDVATVSSSIDAWNTLAGGCNSNHTLFAGASPPNGTGNIAGPVANFFVDLAGGNYRPSAINLGRGQGDPTAPGADHDIDGTSRPSTPDDGAYEVP